MTFVPEYFANRLLRRYFVGCFGFCLFICFIYIFFGWLQLSVRFQDESEVLIRICECATSQRDCQSAPEPSFTEVPQLEWVSHSRWGCSSFEITPLILWPEITYWMRPLMSIRLQEGCWLTGESPAGKNKSDQKARKHELWGKTERVGFV